MEDVHIDRRSQSQDGKSATTTSVSEDPPPMGTDAMPHPIWTQEELHNVQITHKPPQNMVDKVNK